MILARGLPMPQTDFPPSAAQVVAHHQATIHALTYMRMVRSEGRALRGLASPTDCFKVAWPRTPDLDRIIRAAVGGAGSVGWGAPLAGDPVYSRAFLELIRPLTILGRLQGVRWTEPRTWTPKQTGGAVAGWIKPGGAFRVTKAAFEKVSLGLGQLSALMVTSDELISSASPDAEQLFQDDLVNAITEATDRSLTDPTEVEIEGVCPASITASAAYSIPSSGDPGADAAALLAHMAGALDAFRSPYFITSTAAAAAMASLRTPDGLPIFPGVTTSGGVLNGVPLIASAACPPLLILLDASQLVVGDGGLGIEVSKATAVEMNDSPTSDSVAPTTARLTSMFQTNSTAVRALRYLWWQLSDPNACSYVTGFAPGASRGAA
jgi:HK97 family phage major capsid protein